MIKSGEKIPDEWEIKNIEEAVDILDRHREPINKDNRQKRIESIEKNDRIPYYGATGQAGWIDDYMFDEELVLLGEDGAPFDNPIEGVSYMIEGKSWVNNHAHVLRAQDNMLNKFLHYYLLTVDYRPYVRGATRQKLTQTEMKKIPIPVPPLDEQDRIVEAVEERLERVERLERSVENIGRLSYEYQDSFKISLFSGLDNLTDNVDVQNLSDSIPDKWEMKKFGEVIQSSLYGCNPETGEDIDGVPYLRISDIREDGGLKYSELPEKAKFEGESDAEKYSLNNGDIVIARTGGRLCGKSYVYEPRHGDMVYASYLIRFKLNTNKVAKEYIKAYLQSPIYWRQVWSGKKPSTSTRQNINAGEIKSFKIPVPPIEKQQDIVNSLRETDYSSIQRASDNLSHLFNEYRESVLASAFERKVDYQS